MSSLQRLKDDMFLRYLMWRVRPGLVRRYLGKKAIQPSLNLRLVDPRRVRVAAVQVELRLAGDPLEYVEQMYGHVKKAAAGGAQLVVFPEDNATHLLGLLPGLDRIPSGASLEGALGALGAEVKVSDIFAYLTPAARSLYTTTFAELARGFRVYIMAGSLVAAGHDRKVRNTAHLFGPDGRVIGSQAKAHLMPLEAGWGLAPGDDLRVFPTPLGKLAMPVCMDATYFETFRLLSLLGAEVVMVPSADIEYTYWKALRGIWPRVQESLVYGIKSSMVADDFLGLSMAGRSGIFAPLELTPARDGILAQASSSHQEEVVLADLDLVALRQVRRSSALWGDLNPELYKRYLPSIYDAVP
ncbi:hypothetical protein SY88_08035 [Clostridiales bacterium PH28_bin88]|nr:hypothetical protein SY88_08035 [Clostridiales bacterium PH28_bin88]